MIRSVHVIGLFLALLAMQPAASQQAPVAPVLFLADHCSDSTVWPAMLRLLPQDRFGGEATPLYQAEDGGVYSRSGRRSGDAPSFAIDFYDPSGRTFAGGIVAGIPTDRKVEQLRAALDHIAGATGQRRVIVVAHGMGGLVARAYIQGRGVTAKGTAIPYRFDVAGLIAIDTPHAGVEPGRLLPPEWDRECAAADSVNRREMGARGSPLLDALNRQGWPAGTRLDAIVSYRIDSSGETDGLVSRASQDIASVSEYWDRHPDVRVWPQRFLEEAPSPAGAATLHTAVVRSPVTAALVSGIVEELDAAGGAAVAAPRDHVDSHIESPHPYTNNYDHVWAWTAPGNPAAVDVTFDPQTWVEDDYDFIHVMDGAGANVTGSPFTGSALAGRTIRVPGRTVRVRLTTDASVTGYGLRVTALTAVGESALPESSHPYADNADLSWSYTQSGNPGAIDVRFDPQTWVEAEYDFIYVMDGAGANIPGSPFTGASLAGRTVRVPGATVRVRLTSDASITGYGFRVTSVAAATTAPARRTWTLSGAVRDAQTNAALGDATVLVTDGPNASRQAVTGATGAFSIANLEQGNFSIRVSRSGYDAVTRAVTLTQDTRLDLTLTRTAPQWTVIRAGQSGTSVCRQSVGTEPVSFGVPWVRVDRDTANVDVGGSAELLARPVGTRAEDVTLRWWLERYGSLRIEGCEATFLAPDSIGSAFQVSADIYVAKDGNRRRGDSFTGEGWVRVNIYDNRNRLAPCSAPVTISVGGRYGGIVSVTIQGVGTFTPAGAPATYTLPVNVRRGLYTLTLVSTGQPTYRRNISVGCPRTTVLIN